FLSVLARGVTVVEGALFGIKAAVLVIVVEALVRIGRRGLKSSLLVGLAAAAFVGIFFLDVPFPLIVIGAGLIGFVVARSSPEQLGIKQVQVSGGDSQAKRWRQAGKAVAIWLPIWWAPVAIAALALGSNHALVQIGVFFSKLAVVSFGGAYALLAYMAQQAVENYGWMSAPEMVDGLGFAETLPGPLIKVTQFVGFLGAWRSPEPFSPVGAAVLGSVLTTWVTFVPPMMMIFAGAPFVEQLRANQRLSGALAAITAAVVGVILNLTIWFVLHVLFADVQEMRTGPLRWYAFDIFSLDLKVAALALVAAILAFRFHRGLVQLVAIMAALGIAVRFLS
ncbi:MAG: chromate transporter, partial [Panacagrimonas sp.]